MALKLSSLRLSKKITRWIHQSAYFSTLPCAKSNQIIPEPNQDPAHLSEFEGKIQFLKNKLHPDSLIGVLDSTNDLNSSLKLFKWASLQKRFYHTADTYFRIISKLGMAGMVKEVEAFSNEMVKERCPGSEEALWALIDLFVRNCRLDEALRVLVTLNSGGYQPSISVFNVLLDALVEEKKDFRSVLFVYKEMVKAGIVPTVDTLNYLLEALLEADRIGTVMDQYRRMRKKGCHPNSRTFEILIGGLIAKKQVDESVVVLNEMFELGCELEFSLYTRLIPLFCRMNILEEGMRLFKMMRASNVVPDLLTYVALIQCLCKNLHMNDAVNLVDEMTDNDLMLPDHVFVDIVDGFCTLGKLDEAKSFLEDRPVLETHSCNALLGGYCDALNFLGAKGLFDKMVERNVASSQSWNLLIRCLSENGRTDIASQFLCRMIVSSFAPDSATYSALIIGKCNISEPVAALELFNLVQSRCWILDFVSYAKLVECLCQREKIQEAADVFCYMSSNRCTLQSSSFDMLIKGLCVTGNVDRAIRLLSSVSYCGTSCSTATYNAVMVSLSQLEKADELLVMLSKMIVQGCPLDAEAYCVLIRSKSASREMEDCALFLNRMVGDGLLPDSETLTNLLSVLAEHGQLHIILATIYNFVSKDEILNPAMFNKLINGLWNEGYKTEARHLLDVMLEKGWVPDATTHQLLIRSVVRGGTKCELASNEKFDMQDNISSILVEGLEI
ncbi:hypothetical protein RJ640_008787 [Escallonia rubra]|uniref:Pentatricopeptide repeat-containing protein n=1 Tax=Escallonia rubra TaxID=112253 RepID=A0AA88UAA8_9ASTE|nr:hypothetical protein RJ640_008787 [Escallonia rubra]